jgi:hypothetical protein
MQHHNPNNSSKYSFKSRQYPCKKLSKVVISDLESKLPGDVVWLIGEHFKSMKKVRRCRVCNDSSHNSRTCLTKRKMQTHPQTKDMWEIGRRRSGYTCMACHKENAKCVLYWQDEEEKSLGMAPTLIECLDCNKAFFKRRSLQVWWNIMFA